ncbi:MAG: right-handed parallel beta-helix repeat-containing protein [Gemmatimonadaceae bacterium]|nr:right-handed parallel beta-helix repeat-containing protein [Gemmatimonadaceae bacterium]
MSRQTGAGTRINLHNGVYREGIDRFIDSSGQLIVIEAVNVGEAIVSGADVFADWTCSNGLCEHHWPHGWGADQNPWEGTVRIGELARRREMVVVDGVNLAQVLSRGALEPGAFYVDQASSRLIVRPPSGSSLNDSLVEVAVRRHLLRMQGLSDFVIRGVRFQHAASAFRRAAVEIVDQNDVTIEDSWFEWNGQVGLALKGFRLNIRNTVMNNNGASGIGGFQVGDVLLEESETSFNNWRGLRGGFTGWDVGNKIFAAHRVIVRRHTAMHNESRGLWFDIDIVDVVVEDSVLSDNRLDGLFLEKAQGPIVVRDNTISCNGESGILTSALNDFLLERNRVEFNATGAVKISGSFDVRFSDFETGERLLLNNSEWTWRDNVFSVAGRAPLVTTTHGESRWRQLIATSNFEGNRYLAGTAEAFRPPGERLTFSQWQRSTGQDRRSRFTVIAPGR